MLPSSFSIPTSEPSLRVIPSITLYILGFDRPGFTHEILKAANTDDLAHILAVRLESNGLRSEGYLRVQVARPDLLPVLLRRLKAIAGLVRVCR